MDEETLKELGKLVGEKDHLIYQAVKAGGISRLSGESRSIAEAIQDHLHLSHVRNAFEFADVREGQPYEIQHEGTRVNPLAHVTLHAAVKESIKQHEWARWAFSKLLSEGVSKHHAEHILSMIFTESLWNVSHGGDAVGFRRGAEEICASRKVRRRWIRTAPEGHASME
jgi:hypothetical protein